MQKKACGAPHVGMSRKRHIAIAERSKADPMSAAAYAVSAGRIKHSDRGLPAPYRCVSGGGGGVEGALSFLSIST